MLTTCLGFRLMFFDPGKRGRNLCHQKLLTQDWTQNKLCNKHPCKVGSFNERIACAIWFQCLQCLLFLRKKNKQCVPCIQFNGSWKRRRRENKEARSSIESEKQWKQLFTRFTLYLHKQYQCKSSQWKTPFASFSLSPSLSNITSRFQR